MTLASFVCARACWYVGGAQTLPCMLWAELCGSRLVGFSCTKTLGTVRANPHNRVFVFRRTAPQKCVGAVPHGSRQGIYFLLATVRFIHGPIAMFFFCCCCFCFCTHDTPPPTRPPRSSLVNGNTYLTNRPLTLGREHPVRHFSAEFPGVSETSRISSFSHLTGWCCVH